MIDKKEKKVSIITGRSKGIGYACAQKLAKEGFNIAICSRSRKELKKTILADREWVQAFLQAQSDMRELRIENLNSGVAF